MLSGTPVPLDGMTPPVANVLADLDKQERILRRAFDLNPSEDFGDAHRKIVGSPTFDLLTGDAAGMLSGVRAPKAATAFFKAAEPLMDQSLWDVAERFQERGVGRVLKQREELEPKLLRATGQTGAIHELGPVYLPNDGAA